MEEKNYVIEDFREGLGLNANAGHSIRVVGKKAAAFTNRVKTAISANYHKVVNSIREKAAEIKEAVVSKATEIKEAAANKAGEIRTGAINATTHAMNSIDMHAYHLAQEDYQKIMNKKTSKLDSKIANITNNMEAIKNAKIGYGKNQVVDEKERAYLLHRAKDLIAKYSKERNEIAAETMQIASYEKGQNEKIKIAGKRRILIGALDLKRIVTNAAKATATVGTAILSSPAKIANAAKGTMNKMQEKMLERKLIKDAKKQQEAEEAAKKLAEEEEMRLQAELNGKSIEEVFNELSDEEVEIVTELTEIESNKIAANMRAISENMEANARIAELRSASTKANYVVDQIAKQNPVMSDINKLGDNLVVEADKIIKENPEQGLSLIQETNEKEAAEKNKQTNLVKEEKEKSYQAGLEAGRKETSTEIDKLRAMIENLQEQVAKLSTPAKKEETIDYNSMKKDELKEIAKEKGIEINNSMKKTDLIDSLTKSELQGLKEKVETNKKK